MAAVSASPDERARKIVALIFQRLSSVGQATLAEALGTSDPTISRWKTEQVEFTAKALAALGIKVVPLEMRCFDPQQISAILVLAKERLSQIENADQLAWEDV